MSCILREREQEEKMKNSLKETKNLVVLGMLLALTIILDLTPLGAIPMGGISATIVHLPTILAGILLGPILGAVMGFMFGIVSFLHALLRNTGLPFDLLFLNPLISVLPRIFIGVGAYYAYAGIKFVTKAKMMNPVPVIIGALLGSFTNTILVLGMLVIVYGGKIESMLGEAGLSVSAFGWALGVAGANGVIEAIVSAVILTPIALAYFTVYKKTK